MIGLRVFYYDCFNLIIDQFISPKAALNGGVGDLVITVANITTRGKFIEYNCGYVIFKGLLNTIDAKFIHHTLINL